MTRTNRWLRTSKSWYFFLETVAYMYWVDGITGVEKPVPRSKHANKKTPNGCPESITKPRKSLYNLYYGVLLGPKFENRWNKRKLSFTYQTGIQCYSRLAVTMHVKTSYTHCHIMVLQVMGRQYYIKGPISCKINVFDLKRYYIIMPSAKTDLKWCFILFAVCFSNPAYLACLFSTLSKTILQNMPYKDFPWRFCFYLILMINMFACTFL